MLLLPTDADLAGVEILRKKVLMEVTLSGCWWRKGCRFTNHTTTSCIEEKYLVDVRGSEVRLLGDP